MSGFGILAGFGGVPVAEREPPLPPGIWAVPRGRRLAFREGERGLASTFTRASQAWDGERLIGANQMRVFGRDTKSPMLLSEQQVTNYFLHSDNPAEQTITRTGWLCVSMWGSGSLQLSGDSSATVTENNPVYVQVTSSLTITPVGDVRHAQATDGTGLSSAIPTGDAPASRARDGFSLSKALPAHGDLSLHMAFRLPASQLRTGYRYLWAAAGHEVWIDANRIDAGTGAISRMLWDGAPHTMTWRWIGSELTIYLDGATLRTGQIARSAWSIIMLGRRSAVTFEFGGLVAPGAAALGIPFVEQHARDSVEIADMHDRWMQELEKVRLPSGLY